jgi:hypothetical protein
MILTFLSSAEEVTVGITASEVPLARAALEIVGIDYTNVLSVGFGFGR